MNSPAQGDKIPSFISWNMVGINFNNVSIFMMFLMKFKRAIKYGRQFA